MIALLRAHPEGLTTPQIADHFNVTRQTSYNDIKRLETMGVAIWQEGDLYGIDPQSFTQIILNPVQAWFLYLPLRRLVRAQLNRLPVVNGLLYQIARLLNAEIADQLTQDTEDKDEPFNQVLSSLAESWRQKRYAEIKYRRLNALTSSTLVVAVWWFEPAVWTDSFYVIGALKPSSKGTNPPDVITLKLNRIQDARILPEKFERPEGNMVLETLTQTWGIWVGDGEATTVKLRFHNRQYDRLRETRWHPAQRMTLEKDGYVLWQAPISEPQEMLPWIRGWGRDVEVLEPDSIRSQIASDAAATARLYMSNNETDESRLY